MNDIKEIANLIIKESNTQFLLIAWQIKDNFYYIPVIYDAKIDLKPQYMGWYTQSAPNIDNIPVRHSIIEKLYYINVGALILITKDIQLSDIIKTTLMQIMYEDLLTRTQQRYEITLSNICHSIRNPLNAILNHTNNILKTQDDNQKSQDIIQLNKSSVMLANNIFDIVDLTQLELKSFKLDRQYCNLKTIIENAISITGGKITYHIEDAVPLNIHTDSKRLQQIIINTLEAAGDSDITISAELIDRAEIKEHNLFKKEFLHNNVTKELSYSEKKESINDLSVSSNNFYYALSFIIKCEKIFEDKINEQLVYPLELLDNAKQCANGLRVAYYLCNALDGSMKIQQINNFTYFRLCIMVKEDEPYENNNKDMEILIVEDEKINRLVIEQMLQLKGYNNITMTINGTHAIALLKQRRFDVILLDIRMPGISGFEVAAFARQLKPPPYIIGVTAQMLINKEPRYLFDDIIYKPIDWNELETRLLKVIHNES